MLKSGSSCWLKVVDQEFLSILIRNHYWGVFAFEVGLVLSSCVLACDFSVLLKLMDNVWYAFLGWLRLFRASSVIVRALVYAGEKHFCCPPL